MAVGIFVSYAQPAVVTSFPVDTPTTVELRVVSTLLQNLLGNGTGTLDDLRTLRNDQITQGN